MQPLNIGKVYDKPAWSYWWICKEMARYSLHNIIPIVYNNTNFTNLDVLYISSPNILGDIAYRRLPKICKEQGIKVIGGYSGEVDCLYENVDLIVTISPQLYYYAKSKYTDIPVIYLPEFIDTRFFTPNINNNFIPGWAGGKNKQIKRHYLLDNLKYPVKKQMEHGKEFFNESVTLDKMVQFYHSINCFLLPSITECQPRVVMEAMACGLPVIACNVGAVPLLIEKDWIIDVNKENEAKVIEDLNNKLDILNNDKELRLKTGQRNREYIHDYFSWDKHQISWDLIFEALKREDYKTIETVSNWYLELYKDYFKPELYQKQIEGFQKYE
jgi:glycosyltransferase involved in cell wall biosynthesis